MLREPQAPPPPASLALLAFPPPLTAPVPTPPAPHPRDSRAARSQQHERALLRRVAGPLRPGRPPLRRGESSAGTTTKGRPGPRRAEARAGQARGFQPRVGVEREIPVSKFAPSARARRDERERARAAGCRRLASTPSHRSPRVSFTCRFGCDDELIRFDRVPRDAEPQNRATRLRRPRPRPTTHSAGLATGSSRSSTRPSDVSTAIAFSISAGVPQSAPLGPPPPPTPRLPPRPPSP